MEINSYLALWRILSVFTSFRAIDSFTTDTPFSTHLTNRYYSSVGLLLEEEKVHVALIRIMNKYKEIHERILCSFNLFNSII